MIALQTPQGLRFGHIVRIEPPELIFEADARLTEDEEFSWRMELTGYKETVLGRLQVRHVQQRGGGEVPVFHCRIIEIDEDDRDLFEGWLADLAVGGVSRRFERDPSAFVHSDFGHTMRGASRSETSMALDRIQSRRAFRRKLKARQPGDSTSDPLGLHSELATGSTNTAYGREAMRKALRKSMLEREREDVPSAAPLNTPPPKPSPPPRATRGAPNSTSSHSKGPAWLDRLDSTSSRSRPAKPATQAPSHPRPLATPDPEVSFDPHAQPPRVSVHFRTLTAFAREHRDHLVGLGLFVPFPIAAGARVQVSFTLPSGQQLHTSATVVAPMSTGTGLALELSAAHRQLFAKLAAQVTPG